MQLGPTIATQNPAGRERFPGGMVVLLAYLGVNVVGGLAALPDPVPLFFGPYAVSQTVAVGYAMVGVIALGSACYGILKRRAWARSLAVAWLAVQLTVALLNAAGGFLYPQETLKRHEEFMRQYEARHRSVFFGYSFDRAPLDSHAERIGMNFALVEEVVMTSVLNITAIVYLHRRRAFFRP